MSALNHVKNDPRILGDESEQHARGTSRLPTPLFPILERLDRNADCVRKTPLCGPNSAAGTEPESPHINEPAGRCCDSWNTWSARLVEFAGDHFPVCSAANFSLASDGHGGTMITDPLVGSASNPVLLAPPA
jgi:hypothetical protein